MTGTSLNQYQITGQLGAGGMGEVFRARDTRLNREVAVKVLPKDFVADADRLRRFQQEAKTLAALNHPNILTIHDAGVHQGAPYLVSELLEGQTLREVTEPEVRQAITHFQEALTRQPDYALAYAGLAGAYGTLHYFGYVSPGSVTPQIRVAVAKAFDQFLAQAKEKYVPAHAIAGVYDGLGNMEQANVWMNKAIEAREGRIVFLSVSIADDLTRASPYYSEWLKKIGLDK
jgi:tetratricopeptide (TPR) repeat protein